MSSPAATYTRPTLGGLFNLAWPIIISRSTQVVATVFDALMVGYLGEAALAATTTGGFDVFLIFIFFMGVVFIVSSFASQLFGKGDLAGARRFAWYGLAVAGVTQVICLVAMVFVHQLLLPFEFTEEVRGLLETYVRIRLIAGGAVIGVEALANYYSALGNTRLPMMFNIVIMTVDVAGNWLFIRGNWGFPALGVAGAAWTSSISPIIGFIGLFFICLREPGGTGGKLKWSELKEMIRFGVPSGFNWFFDFASFFFFLNIVLPTLGTTVIAAFNSVLTLNMVAFMPAFALASAGSVLIGQAIGAGAKDDVPRTLRMTTISNIVWQSLVGIVYLSIPTLLMTLFVKNDEPNAAMLLEVGASMLMLSTVWQIFDATATAYAEGLRAAGDTKFTAWIRAILAWVVFAPGSYISIRWLGHGPMATILWFTLYIALLAVVLVFRFRSGSWRNIELTENV